MPVWKEVGMELKRAERAVRPWSKSDHRWRREEEKIGWKHHRLPCRIRKIQQSLHGTLESWVGWQRILRFPRNGPALVSLLHSITGGRFQSTAAGVFGQWSKWGSSQNHHSYLCAAQIYFTQAQMSAPVQFPRAFLSEGNLLRKRTVGRTAALATSVSFRATAGAHLWPFPSILNAPQAQLSARWVLVAYWVVRHKPSSQKVTHTPLSPGLLPRATQCYVVTWCHVTAGACHEVCKRITWAHRYSTGFY